MSMQFRDPSYVSLDGRKLAYEETSPAASHGTVLFISGLAAKRQGWFKQVPVFGEHYRTIVFDNRDIGQSDYVTTPYRTSDQADDAAALLRELGVARAHVVAISMGGFIALELTLRHPELVEKLVLTSTSAGGRTHVQPNWLVRLMLVVPRFGRSDPARLTVATYTRIMAPGYLDSHPAEREAIAEIARFHPQPPAAYRRQLQACVHHDVAGRLGEIKARTLVVHGEVDPLVPVGNGKYLASHIPGARLILYQNTGHIPIIERAGDYNRDVLGFLAE